MSRHAKSHQNAGSSVLGRIPLHVLALELPVGQADARVIQSTLTVRVARVSLVGAVQPTLTVRVA